MLQRTIMGIDLGGTNVSAGVLKDNELSGLRSMKLNTSGSESEVLSELFRLIDDLMDPSVSAIGIGVPGLVDTEKKLVFDLVNIPAWKEIPLQQLIEDRYKVPVKINNDANCFALGEYHFGKGAGFNSMVGLTIGTGLGAGLIVNKKLYSGRYCGAGEFGTMDYLNKTVEYYASGRFFENVYHTNGEEVFEMAQRGNAKALRMYEEMGTHLGNAIKIILYALDVEMIILGGSVRHAFAYFSTSMYRSLDTYVYRKSAENLKIEVSGLANSGILGAAALFYEE